MRAGLDGTDLRRPEYTIPMFIVAGGLKVGTTNATTIDSNCVGVIGGCKVPPSLLDGIAPLGIMVPLDLSTGVP